MRPPSEIHSALALLQSELDRLGPRVAWFVHHADADAVIDSLSTEDAEQLDSDLVAWNHLRIASDILAWVAGGSAMDFTPPTDWLCAFLLDDPAQLNDAPPENN
jgi:hypothetical protein